jgi:nucleotide-binding universal stress UspA family protein
MFEKILVPLDGSALAATIVSYVGLLARGLKAKVTLLTVVDPHALDLAARLEERSPSAIESGGPYASQIFARVERSIKERLQNGVDSLYSQGIQAESKVVLGEVAEEIVKVAKNEGYGLIAMSTHARRALARGIVGSVTDKVVHASSVPVFTITPAEARKYWQRGMSIKTVVVPLDGSSWAEMALPYAEELAQKLTLNVVLARAVDIGVFTVIREGRPYISPTPLDEELEQEANYYLGGVAEKLKARGLNVTTRLLSGNAARAIVDLAHETPQSIVTMTTRGRSGINRWFVGSVTEKVIRLSGQPVLVVPPPYQQAAVAV